ncbi:MAG: gliding motility-associated C-terminal domain-containing protein, partial [Saprospiraceae bacterium]|nr:gliding motility-associated C-terminal domain-containing protein [Saprospiraceae bacterium]
VTGANGCASTATATVTNNSFTPLLTGAATPNTACTTPNGSINLTVNPGGAYTYQWSNTETTEDLTDLTAGVFSVTVSAGGNCTASASYTVENNSPAPDVDATITPAICGASNGAIDLTVAPAGSYLYIWSNTEQTEDLASISAGVYSVTVTQLAGGCTAIGSYSIPNNSSSFVLSGLSTPDTSCTSSTGAISINVAPVGSYTFLWSNGLDTEDIDNLAAGTYTLTVTDASACPGEISIIVAEQLNFPVINGIVNADTCGQQLGSIDLQVAPQFSAEYYWSNNALTEDLHGLSAGSYAVTCTANNGCSASMAFTVPDINIPIGVTGVVTANTACANFTGGIDISLNQPGNFAYLWSDASTTEDLLGVAPGNYSLTVTQGATCSSTAVFFITNDPILPNATATATPDYCGQYNGSVQLNITPSNGYDVLWNNGWTTDEIQSLGAGVYSATITLVNGCTTTVNATVPAQQNAIDLSTTISDNTSCNTPDGSIDLSVSPPGNYSYTWTNGATVEDLDQLPYGQYSVTVQDAFGCEDTVDVVIGGPYVPQATILGPVSACAMAPVNWEASPGFAAYLWSNGETTATISPQESGLYSVTVWDDFGCSATAAQNFASLPLPIVTIAGPSSTCESAIPLSVSGGVFTQITWNTGDHTADITVTQTGVYSATVTAANGCTATVVQQVSFLTPPLPEIQQVLAPCEQVAVLTASGGFAAYLWSNGATTDDITVDSAGNFGLTVTDINGCTGTTAVSVDLPPLPSAWISGAAIVCQGNSTVLSAPPGMDTYLWSTGATSNQITVDISGGYTLIVTDADGCTAEASLSVTVLPQYEILIEQAVCNPQDTGVVTVSLTSIGGCDSIITIHSVQIPPVVELVQMAACSGESVMLNGVAMLAGSTHDFVFTAANGCDSIVRAIVTAYPEVSFNSTIGRSCWNMPTGSLHLNIGSGQPPFTIMLDGTASDQVLHEDLSGGQHIILVEDANGCIREETVDIPETEPIEIFILADTLSCEQNTVLLQPLVSGGQPGTKTWTWSDGSHDPWLSVSAAGLYTVRVEDACEAVERQVEVVQAEEVLPRDFVYVPNCFSPNDDGENDLFQVFIHPEYEVVAFEFRVFDRWGNALYVTADWADGWDGVFRETPMQPAVYVWYMSAKIIGCNGRTVDIFKKGDVTIVR